MIEAFAGSASAERGPSLSRYSTFGGDNKVHTGTYEPVEAKRFEAARIFSAGLRRKSRLFQSTSARFGLRFRRGIKASNKIKPLDKSGKEFLSIAF